MWLLAWQKNLPSSQIRLGGSFLRLKRRALIVVSIVISIIVSVFFVSGYFVTLIFRIPVSFAFPLEVRFLGLVVLALGFALLGWLFKYRKPIDIIVSTYFTFLKAGKRVRLEDPVERTESFVINGPYRYVRHPLYLCVVILVLGWWLLLDYSFLVFSATFLLLWFNFVVIPFEEEELRAIFREQYEQYSKEVPKMIPFTKRAKK